MTTIPDNKNYRAPSLFAASALLREARRQKNLEAKPVPPICILDPDGDIVRRVRRTGDAKPSEVWPCYHTQLDCFNLAGQVVGVVGCAVGAPFAVLIAEELFASGCEFLISLTSAGRIASPERPPFFVIIDRALRDEGTSYHYAPATEFAHADPALVAMAFEAVRGTPQRVIVGASWTTDAPFRETAEAIEWARSRSAIAVEMEAAALYTFAETAKVKILCLAHVTNTMGQSGEDFEKGEADGTADALAVLGAISQMAKGRLKIEHGMAP
ncbi:MAG TPA: nucleoside phosphorylase [Pseudolabrys sp.]|nr:nucleoside phosphorylase [Pseudolabrys sp.]